MTKSGQNLVATISYRTRSSGLAPWGPTQIRRIYDSYELVSTNHPGWWRNTSGDSGGPFFVSKTTARHQFGRGANGVFEGQFMCMDPVGFTQPFLAYDTPSNSSLDAKGTTAIARTEPTKSVADVATFIGELRTEGLPRLNPEVLKASTKKARAAGSDYLNVEFGWKPVVNDLQKLFLAVSQSHQILENYHKHGNGQKLRRRYAFPTQSESAYATAGNFLPSPDVGAFGSGSIFTRRQQDMWFSGAFRYYIPIPVSTMDSIRGYASDVQKLSGVALTPEVVWNLQPWSWLVDWQSNVGDVLHNISSMGRDGLVLQYGYVMCSSLHETSRCADFGPKLGFAGSIITSYSKVRRPATPYGFGVDLGGLTTRQGAILAALGLSRT